MSNETFDRNGGHKDVPSGVDDMSWRDLESFAESDDFEAVLEAKFPREAAIYKASGMSRRSFIKLMGASLALGGLSLTGCTPPRRPEDQIIAYARMPEELIPGRPLHFASTIVENGYGVGVLIETHEGRPHRVEGNPNHPGNLGGLTSSMLASVLELYNPQRSTRIRDVANGAAQTWDQAAAALDAAVAAAGENGAGLRILTETVTSPSLRAQFTQLLERFPEAGWVQYDPINDDNAIAGAQLAFNEAVDTVYDFSQAQVILTLDGDFLANMRGSLRYARDFADARRVRSDHAEMNRLYAVESAPTLTGAKADNRLKLRASEVEAFARALAAAFGLEVDAASGSWSPAWVNQVVGDLQEAGANALVVVGRNQPPAVHALAHAINAQLGAVGTTVSYTPPVAGELQTDALRGLVSEMEAGTVNTLLILGGNPVYNAPVDLDFAGALNNVGFKLHLSLYEDETSALCDWHVPQTHYVEEWSDARTYDGTVSLVQPPIGPLYETVKSDHDILARLLGDESSPYEIVRQTWEAQADVSDFETFWRLALQDGFFADSAPEALNPTLVENLGEAIGNYTAAEGLEVVFRPDPALVDGRYAWNSWLQELPDPLTKISWDTAALVSAATAERLNLTPERLVQITVDERSMRAPLWIVPGHPDDSVTVMLGYGRGLSAEVEAGFAFNAYAIRTANAPWFATNASLSMTREDYPLAVAEWREQVDELHPVRAGTLAEFQRDPSFAQEKIKPYNVLPGFDYDGNSWGMTIDLTSCIGCNACMVACQSENNIPTVGKAEVMRSRDMHWIRVDRIYQEHDGQMDTYFQPVPCMHCENAPCEQVCPVQATVHSTEGLNQMIYNRCIGTRYCSANCPYAVRRFNFFDYVDPDPLMLEMRNPDVSVRYEGVMEKCTYCVQRIAAARIDANNENRPIRDGEIVPACAASCPTQAIVFGNLNDANAQVVANKNEPLNYDLLGELNTFPRTSYLARISNPNESLFGAEEEEA